MNKAANSYWTDTRLAAQRPAARALTLVSPAHELTHNISVASSAAAAAIAATRVEARGRRFTVPSWVAFGMIIFATFAMCVTVTMRTHAEMNSAAQKHSQISADVKQLREGNAAIRHEVERLSTDRRAIEAAARTKLNMVRADEIVVPVD